MLKISELRCVRGESVLFDHVNIEVQPGSALLISGANGSGKTSLLRILCGLSLPDSGNVFWEGHDILDWRESYHENLSYLGHRNGLHGDLSIVENLRQESPRNDDAVIKDALATVELSHRGEQLVKTLSQGQQRRTALARILVQRRPLWILDEPFNALDKASVKKLTDILNQHVAQRGMLVFTSHYTIDIDPSKLTELIIEAPA